MANANDLFAVVKRVIASVTALESLRDLDSIILENSFEVCDDEKKFIFRTRQHQVLFYGADDPSDFRILNRYRPFHVKLLSPVLKEEVMNVYRAAWTLCYPLLGAEQVKVTSTVNDVNLGYVDEVARWWSFGLALDVKDADGKILLLIRDRSSRAFWKCNQKKTFQILDTKRALVGYISEEASTAYSSFFAIGFSPTLGVHEKALVMAAALMLVSDAGIIY